MSFASSRGAALALLLCACWALPSLAQSWYKRPKEQQHAAAQAEAPQQEAALQALAAQARPLNKWLQDQLQGVLGAASKAGQTGPLDGISTVLEQRRKKLRAAMRDFQAAQRLRGLDAEHEAQMALMSAELRDLGNAGTDDSFEHAMDVQQLAAHQASLLAQVMEQGHASVQLEKQGEAFQLSVGVQGLTQATATQTQAEQAQGHATTQFDMVVEDLVGLGQQLQGSRLGSAVAEQQTALLSTAADAVGEQIDAAYQSDYEQAAAQALVAHQGASMTLEAAQRQRGEEAQATRLGSMGVDVLSRLREVHQRPFSFPWALLGAQQRLEDARDPDLAGTWQAQSLQAGEYDDDKEDNVDTYKDASSVLSQLDVEEAQALRRDLDNLDVGGPDVWEEAQALPGTEEAAQQAELALPKLAAHLVRGMVLRATHAQQQQGGAGSQDAVTAPAAATASSSSSSHAVEGQDTLVDLMPGQDTDGGASAEYELEAAAVRDALLLGPLAFVRRFVQSMVDHTPPLVASLLGAGAPGARDSHVIVLPGQMLVVQGGASVYDYYDEDNVLGADEAAAVAELEQWQEAARGGEVGGLEAGEAALGPADGVLTFMSASDDLFSSGWVGTLPMSAEDDEEGKQPAALGTWGLPHSWQGLMPQGEEARRERYEVHEERQVGTYLVALLAHVTGVAVQATNPTYLILDAQLQQQQQAGPSVTLPAQQQQEAAGLQRRVPYEWAGLLEADGSVNLGALLLVALLTAMLLMLVGFVRSLDALQGAMGKGTRGGTASGDPLLVPFLVEGEDGSVRQGYLVLSEEELAQAAGGYTHPAAPWQDSALAGDMGKGAAQAAWGAKQAEAQRTQHVALTPPEAQQAKEQR